MKIVGLACGAHDTAYCIFEDGKTVIHEEYERFSRIKEEQGDVLKFVFDRNPDLKDVDYFTHFFMRWRGGLNNMYRESFSKMSSTGAKYLEISHHKAHAANAFFSSNFKDAFIISIDGGGEECDDWQTKTHETALAFYSGKDNKVEKIEDNFPNVNVGHCWSMMTKEVFGLSSGPPIGNQCGTVMAMGAVAKNPNRFLKEMREYLKFRHTNNFVYYSSLTEEEKFDLAGSLQKATEEYVLDLIGQYMPASTENICVVGGVALNGLLNQAILNKFDNIKDIYIPPVPYDAGLAMGCCQYIYYHMHNNPRKITGKNESPYLGCNYKIKDVKSAIKKENKIKSKVIENEDEIINLLLDQKIISIFNKSSESGRRALGNRSILADPRSSNMKDIINEKVKHRQWFRPFAPVILKEHISDWFETHVESPYMNIISQFKESKKSKVPAVVHHDGTGRFQSVKKSDNSWLHSFLTKWNEASGVPILLNTSFNDREPIVETPTHAINCFLKTDIDYLYFPEYKLLVEKCQKIA